MSYFARLLAFAVLAQVCLSAPALAQLRPPVKPAETAEPVIDPKAKKRWDAFLEASRLDESARAPITAFRLAAFVRSRVEGTNDLNVIYEFAAPNLLRFELESGRTIGRSTAVGLDAYWLVEKDKTTRLNTREHANDRGQIDTLLAIAQNFVALSAPETLKLERLEPCAAPKHVLPERRIPGTLTLDWIRIVSRDFGLPASVRFGPAGQRSAWVEIGIDKKTSLPRLVIVGHEHAGAMDVRLDADPVLFHLPKRSFTARDGFLAPGVLHVHRLVPTETGIRFAQKAEQEITLNDVDLRAKFPEGHFEPGLK